MVAEFHRFYTMTRDRIGQPVSPIDVATEQQVGTMRRSLKWKQIYYPVTLWPLESLFEAVHYEVVLDPPKPRLPGYTEG